MCDPYAYFDFILIYIWFKQYVPKYSSDKVTQVKSREEVSGSAAFVSVKLIENANEGYKLVHVRK